MYFETGGTRKAYIEMPLDHPDLLFPHPANGDDDRDG
jgi:hypothetical protein